MLKPTPGKSMFNFGSFIDSSKSPSLSPDKNFRGQPPISPDSEAKPLPGSRQPQNASGLMLSSQESSAEAHDAINTNAFMAAAEEKKSKRPQMGIMIEDSQEEEERDSDGQNAPELIIPKQSRAPRQ